MHRREFLKKTTVITGLGLAIISCGDNSHEGDSFSETGINDLEPTISEETNKKFKEVMIKLISSGWISYLKTIVTIDVNDVSLATINALTVNTPDHLRLTKMIVNNPLTEIGFDDFAGKKLIEPGSPALSLLYHLVASPRVQPSSIRTEDYLSFEEMDAIENYIYALKKLDISEAELLNNYVLAVFAYEYRPAYKTPHHIHADLVFSRTGIGRIGNDKCYYDPKNRCYVNESVQSGSSKISVRPSRFGLFLAKVVKANDIDVLSTHKFKGGTGSRDSHDDRDDISRAFLIPVRKIFNDDNLLKLCKINYEEYHKNEKLYRISESKTSIKNDLIAKGFKLNEPPFVVDSKSMEPIVESAACGSSILIKSKPKELVRLAVQNENPVSCIFPSDNGSNRYFTGYSAQITEYIEVLESGYRKPNKYGNVHNSPMYVNITNKLNNNKKSEPIPLDAQFESNIAKSHTTPLFEDSICDGYVAVNISGIGSTSGIIIPKFLLENILPAFSIITAPDFFPYLDPFDLIDFDVAPGLTTESIFLEGGVASLASCRIVPNANHSYPYNTTGKAFPYKSTDTYKNRANTADTLTAVTSEKPKPFNSTINYKIRNSARNYNATSFLPDNCTSVFAPGWDITFSSFASSAVYLSTQGLGSPFVEDMKFCAAMNGMWAGSSPDAARTYQGSVTINEQGKYMRNPTAIPLMDNEIGIHSNSPGSLRGSVSASFGWDGEQGPFLMKNSANKWVVDFTDLGRANYVQNALNDQINMATISKLDNVEVFERITCLKNAIRAIPGDNSIDRYVNPWLISAEKINWAAKDKFMGIGIPDGLFTQGLSYATTVNSVFSPGENVYLFVLVKTIYDTWIKPYNGKRRQQVCTEIYVYQVSSKKSVLIGEF